MPHRRHEMGKRRIVLAGGAAYCLSRAAAYAPGVRTEPVQEPLVAAAGGSSVVLFLYVIAWAFAGVWCIANVESGKMLHPMALTCGLMAAWGTAWFIGWTVTPDTLWWQTALTYWGPAVMLMASVALIPRAPERLVSVE